VREVINHLTRKLESRAYIAGRDAFAVGLRNKLKNLDNTRSRLDTRLVCFGIFFGIGIVGIGHAVPMPCKALLVHHNR
jgi:hypothetical protein